MLASQQCLHLSLPGACRSARAQVDSDVACGPYPPRGGAAPSPPARLQVAYQAIDKLLADPATALKGSLFWQWFDVGQVAPASEGGGRGLFGEGGMVAAGLAWGASSTGNVHALGLRSLTAQSGAHLPASPPCPCHAGIYETDDAFAPILQNAKVVAQLNAQPVAGCVADSRGAAPADPAPDCKQTWVDGEPGTGGGEAQQTKCRWHVWRQLTAHTLPQAGLESGRLVSGCGLTERLPVVAHVGLEGPDCNVPINECVRGTAQCDPHATCIDTDAGYTCQCWW